MFGPVRMDSPYTHETYQCYIHAPILHPSTIMPMQHPRACQYHDKRACSTPHANSRSCCYSARWSISLDGEGRIRNSPHSTGFPDAKVEFVEVTNGVLLILPVGSFLLGAEPALEPILHLLQEPVICLREAEAMVVTHSVDLVLRQGTAEFVGCHSFCESLREPGDHEGFPSSLPE